jgi:type I restriction enzyme S subunit
MSRTNDTAVTKGVSTPTLVPKLRFAEFREAGEWEEKNLTEIAKTSIGLVTTMTTSYANTGVPLIRNSDIQQNKVRKEKLIFLLESFADKYPSKKLKEGDIVTVHTGDIGVSAVVDSDLSGCLGFATLNTRILKHDVLPEYICWYFNSERYICFALSMATGDGRNNFNLSDFDRSVIPIPSQAEQQKIADCLSSLDTLITAQSQKLDALRDYKKGLMLQLFPREGENQPRLRFPEFENGEEWVCEELSSCLNKVIDYRGIAPPKSESGVPLITAKNVRFGWLDMTNDEYIEEDKYEEWMSRGIPQAGDILFTTEAPLGNVALFPPSGKFALGQRLLTLRSKPERCVPAFLFHALLGPTMQDEIDFHGTGSTAKGIKSKVFVKLSFCHPGVQEQQHIATCLSSLDAMITAETQKLDAFKIHKNGLMQQLFPTMDSE